MTAQMLPDLPKQFLIAKSIPEFFNTWKQHSFYEWTVACANDVPIVHVTNASGDNVGVLIGWVISEGCLLDDDDKLKLPSIDFNPAEFLESLCGRYVFLYQKYDDVWVSTDAGGLLPIVYHEERKILASTPTVLAAFGELLPDSELTKAYQIPQKKGWYPFGLTPFQDVLRLIPNHHISLKQWRQERIQPVGNIQICSNENVAQTVKEIADLAVENIGAILKNSEGFVHLTAGYDSRMVLAACRSNIKDCTFETIRMPNQGTELDCFVASALATKFNFKHELLDFVDPTEEEISAWLERTSNCIFDAVTLLGATAKKNDRHSHSITGTCGEVARSYYWADKGLNEQQIDPDTLISRLKVISTDKVRTAAEKWLSELPSNEPSLVWDLAYIEQRLGCWAGPSVYGHDIHHPSLSPFNSTKIYKLMLSLPQEYRQSHKFIDDYMGYLWPELLSYPFNRAFGAARLRFFKAEIRDILPPSIRKAVKALLKRIRG